MILSILKWAGIFVLLSVAAVVGLPWLPVLQDQLPAGAVKSYIEREGVTLDLERADGRMRLSEDIYESQLIIMGEMHGFADVQAFDLAMLRHLHDKVGLRVYLAEINPAMAIAFNAMVLDGDDVGARLVFDAWADQDAQWANNEFFAKLQSIALWNATLPEDSRIVFIGVDKPHDRELAESQSQRVTPSAEPGFGSTDAIRAINDLLLAEALKRDEADGRYRHIIPNIELIVGLPNADSHQLYGLWGIFHTSKQSVNGATPLAMYLNQEGGMLEDNVATIGTYCLTDCYNMMPAGAVPGPFQGKNDEAYTYLPMGYDTAYIYRLRGVGAAKSAMGDDRAVLVPLHEDQSPFLKGSQLSGMSGYLSLALPFEYDRPAAEIFDAVILHKSSPPLTPWADEAYDVSRKALSGR